MVVGPLSFAGLVAPHLARLAGFSRASVHLAGTMLLGALLMIVSDWLSRMAAFPYELPAGLFASLLGGPYLVYLLAKGLPRQSWWTCRSVPPRQAWIPDSRRETLDRILQQPDADLAHRSNPSDISFQQWNHPASVIS